MPVVYADVLIALNWLIDFLLLSATSYLLRVPVRRFRLVLGALFGGFCACLIFLPPFPRIMRILMDIAAAAIMVLIAFPFGRWPAFLKRTAVFFIVSSLFFGVVSMLSSFSGGEHLLVHNGKVYADLSPLMLAIFALVSYGVIRLYDYLTRKRMPKGGEYRLTVTDGENAFVGHALYDTGLHLREPFSGRAVILMEREAVYTCVSEELKDTLENAKPHPRIRQVPYRTVSGEGLLPAFRPKRVQVCRLGGDERDITGVYVAVCERLGRGEYAALIGGDCLEGWGDQ